MLVIRVRERVTKAKKVRTTSTRRAVYKGLDGLKVCACLLVGSCWYLQSPDDAGGKSVSEKSKSGWKMCE